MSVDFFVRLLVGRFFVPTVDIDLPGPSDLLPDFSVRDAIVDAFERLGDAIVQSINDSYVWLIETTISIIGDFGLPPSSLFRDGPLALLVGANFGLTINLLKLAAVFVALVTLIAVARRHRAELGSRFITTILVYAIIIVSFFPLYDIVKSFVTLACSTVIQVIRDLADGNLTGGSDTLLVPDNPIGAFLTALVGTVVLFFVFLEVAMMWMTTAYIVVGYPLVVALRSFGRLGIVMFNFFTALLITIPVSYLLMSFSLSVGLLLVGVIQSIPGDAVPNGVTTFFGVVMSLVGGIAALVIPFVVFFFTFDKTKSISGSVDSRMENAISVSSMPEVTTRDANENRNQGKVALLTTFIAGAGTNAVLSDEKNSKAFRRNIVDRSIDAGKFSPNPQARAVAWAASFMKDYANKKSGGSDV